MACIMGRKQGGIYWNDSEAEVMLGSVYRTIESLCLSPEMSYKQFLATPVNGFLTLLKEVGCLLKALVGVTVTKPFCSVAFLRFAFFLTQKHSHKPQQITRA